MAGAQRTLEAKLHEAIRLAREQVEEMIRSRLEEKKWDVEPVVEQGLWPERFMAEGRI